MPWLRKALTRRIRLKNRTLVLEPDERLVLLVKFAVAMTVCLSGLEIASLLVLRVWSSEVFAGISGLIGTVTGVLIGQHS